MSDKRIRISAVISGLFLLEASCLRTGVDSGRSGAETTADQVPRIQVVSVLSKPLKRLIRLPAELKAYQDVALHPKVEGFIEKIGVDRGSRVRRGELLIQMIAPELHARTYESEAKVQAAGNQVIEARARLQSIRAQRVESEAKLAADDATYKRLLGASATPGAVAGNDLDVAQKTVEAGRARLQAWVESEKAALAQVQSLEESEKALKSSLGESRDIESYLRITAPFDGVITERNVHEGSLVGPAAGPSAVPMLRIQEVARLRLVAPVPEAAVAGVRQGQTVAFSVPAYPGESFNSTVARVAHALDVKTRTMPVELDVDNTSGRLSPGMFAEVQWPERRPAPSLFVPVTSVVVTTERIFVARVRGNIVEWVDVTRGASMDNLVEVFGQLHAGDLIAVRGTDELRTGARVSTQTQ